MTPAEVTLDTRIDALEVDVAVLKTQLGTIVAVVKQLRLLVPAIGSALAALGFVF